MPQIEVMFDVDANGILSVKAKDKATSKEQSIRIEARSSLSKEEIEKMQKDAEMHAQDDLKKKDLVEAKNIGEQLIYTAEKALKDAGDKVTAEIRTGVENKITDLKTVLANTNADLEAIKKATVDLSNETSKIGEAINKANASAGTEAPKQEGENVRDADFEEKKPEDQK
jgi:molecular chaperone DnaK